MPETTLQLTTITSLLPADLELAEAIGFPEVSALGESEIQWKGALQSKCKSILQDAEVSSAVWLHRRRRIIEPELREIEIDLDPPKRSMEWRKPVRLRMQIVQWVEEGDLHQAYVPALRILVFATRASLLDERIRNHVRLVLMGRQNKAGLKQLAALTQIRSLKAGRLEVTARIPTPKELAIKEGQEDSEPSMLQLLAEELPPRSLADNVGNHRPAAKSAPPFESNPASPIAFEMESELNIVAESLAGAQRRSVLLVGPPGCGKTALLRELARRRHEFGFGHTPFWTTHGPRLMTGPVGFGMWQERCEKLCREAGKTNAVLHLGNLADLLEVGKAQRGQQSVGGFIRPWIARGDVLCVAECSPEQLGAIERKDPHLMGAFLQISIPERTAEQTRSILKLVFDRAPGKSDAAKPENTAQALDRLHLLHVRYAQYSANPGRPVRFLKVLLKDRFPDKALDERSIIAAFARETGLPPVLLDDHIPLDLEKTRGWFASRVVGQPEAVERVADLLAVVKARLARPGKPLASLLFAGPTGTGKTELARALAEFLFGDAHRMARFDLNQYNDPDSIQRLMGGPLAGTTEGLLTARVREQPFSVILLDEFEKADASFFDLLLQILGDGRLTDASGRVADFRNCVIVMTSNLGAQGFQKGQPGFLSAGKAAPDALAHFTEAVRQFLRPEIFNRLDSILPFHPLSPPTILAIAERQLGLLRQRLGIRSRPLELNISSSAVECLARKGYDARYGARSLKRTVERELLVPLAGAIAAYSDDRPLVVDASASAERIRVKASSPPQSREPSGQLDLISESQRAGAASSERRLIGRLKNSPAYGELENQATLIESMERRLKGAKWKTPERQARIDKLPRMKACLDAILALYERSQRLEADYLSRLYRNLKIESHECTVEINSLASERRRLMTELFRFQFEQPDDILIAIYGEHKEVLLKLAEAYCQLAGDSGKIMGFDYFLAPALGRSRSNKWAREPAKKLSQPFLSVPEKIIGLAMHLRGDLYYPLLEKEAGLHALASKGKEQLCRVETAPPPFDSYQPPAGIERKGAVGNKSAPLCRSFDRDKKAVADAVLGVRPWNGIEFASGMKALIDERLRIAIERAASE
jgi:DNA polymerase III delta prime subunit